MFYKRQGIFKINIYCLQNYDCKNTLCVDLSIRFFYSGLVLNLSIVCLEL